jgi:hypothetical protein
MFVIVWLMLQQLLDHERSMAGSYVLWDSRVPPDFIIPIHFACVP